MATQEIQRLEKLLDISVQDVCRFSGLKEGKVYYQRKTFPKVYKSIIVGIRMLESNLSIREIIAQIEPTEKLVTKKR